MPRKGLFTQGFCVLTDRNIDMEVVKAALATYNPRYVEATPESNWQMGGEFLVLDGPITGLIATVDIVNRQWPDEMGSPQEDPMTFGAWTMGFFGPLTFPGNLERAVQHSPRREKNQTLKDKHRGFIRLKSCYKVDGPNDRLIPENYKPLDEIRFLTDIAVSLINIPGCLCYFNPGGEMILDKQTLVEWLDVSDKHNLPPIEVWSNIRLFTIDSTWSVMDTIGNEQFDLPDFEAFFKTAQYDASKIDFYLRNITLHFLNPASKILKDGDGIDGPEGRKSNWRVLVSETATSTPPRDVARLVPESEIKKLKQVMKDYW